MNNSFLRGFEKKASQHSMTNEDTRLVRKWMDHIVERHTIKRPKHYTENQIKTIGNDLISGEIAGLTNSLNHSQKQAVNPDSKIKVGLTAGAVGAGLGGLGALLLARSPKTIGVSALTGGLGLGGLAGYMHDPLESQERHKNLLHQKKKALDSFDKKPILKELAYGLATDLYLPEEEDLRDLK